jgi:hypothetical protein
MAAMIPSRWSRLAALAFVYACSPGAAASTGDAPGAQHGEDASREAGVVTARDSALDAREPGALRGVHAAPVVGRMGPGGRPFEVALRTPGTGAHMRPFGRTALPVALRADAADLSQYPCTTCHMGRRTVLRDERTQDAHANLVVSHPRETGATCITCHSSDDVEHLALRTGEPVTLDHAYRVCAQCHFGQAEGWAAGAHGKRLDGWQGRRVVMGCTDCHDPHAPSLRQRLPFRPPTLHRPGITR